MLHARVLATALGSHAWLKRVARRDAESRAVTLRMDRDTTRVDRTATLHLRKS